MSVGVIKRIDAAFMDGLYCGDAGNALNGNEHGRIPYLMFCSMALSGLE